jgi:hypothetical protein
MVDDKSGGKQAAPVSWSFVIGHLSLMPFFLLPFAFCLLPSVI